MSSPARTAPYRFVLWPAPPVKLTLPRTRSNPYQFKPPLISRSPSTIRTPAPWAAEVSFTLPGMYSVTVGGLTGSTGGFVSMLGGKGTGRAGFPVVNCALDCVPQLRYDGGVL